MNYDIYFQPFINGPRFNVYLDAIRGLFEIGVCHVSQEPGHLPRLLFQGVTKLRGSEAVNWIVDQHRDKFRVDGDDPLYDEYPFGDAVCQLWRERSKAKRLGSSRGDLRKHIFKGDKLLKPYDWLRLAGFPEWWIDIYAMSEGKR